MVMVMDMDMDTGTTGMVEEEDTRLFASTQASIQLGPSSGNSVSSTVAASPASASPPFHAPASTVITKNSPTSFSTTVRTTHRRQAAAPSAVSFPFLIV